MNKISHSSPTIKRKQRVRGKIHGTSDRPRVTIYRSLKYTYLQVIDDEAQKTLAASCELMIKKSTGKALKGTKLERTTQVAQDLAEKLKAKKINRLAFDRGSYRYHGRVRKVADTLREAGLEV